MNTKRQGAIGVAKAVAYFAELGYVIFVPVSDVSRYDLIVEKDNILSRVEVKTTTSQKDVIMLRNAGGNQSWSGVVKHMSSKDCDLVFMVNLNTGTIKVMTSVELDGRASIVVR